MNLDSILQNFSDPAILFFFLGVLAVLLRSDLEIPQPLPKLFSLYLLMVIGLRGGFELKHSGINLQIAMVLLAAMGMAIAVPLIAFFILKRKLSAANAAAIAATYGSISAVTFITAISFLDRLQVDHSGYMVAAMALMESPAIVVGVILARKYAPQQGIVDIKHLLKEAFLNGSVFLILGSMFIGIFSGVAGEHAFEPFMKDIFKGMLAFFLLDMGLVAAKRLGIIRRYGVFIIGFAILMPLAAGLSGMGISLLLRLSVGDALLFTVLCGSASYIAVPAAMRLAVPDANPSLYVPMALAITFPFNISIGIPLYYNLISLLIA